MHKNVIDSKRTGKLISSCRKEKGLTQRELANILHVSDRTVSKWETGAGFPDVSLLADLAEVLDLSLSELLEGEKSDIAADESKMAISESEMREAMTSVGIYLKQNVRKMRCRVIAAVLLGIITVSGAYCLIQHMGENRILFPPDIQCEVLQKDQDFEIDLIIDRANSGVYDYVCAYEIDRYGNTALVERDQWQSYTDCVPKEIYRKLKAMQEAKLILRHVSPHGCPMVCCMYCRITAAKI